MASAKDVAANASAFTTNLNAHNEDLNQIIANAKDLSDRLKGDVGEARYRAAKANDFLGGSGDEGKNFFAEATAAAKSIRADRGRSSTRRRATIFGGVARILGPRASRTSPRWSRNCAPP